MVGLAAAVDLAGEEQVAGVIFLSACWAYVVRFWTWLTTHPKVAAVGAALAAFGAMALKLVWTQRKQRQAEVRAETAEVEGQVAVTHAHQEEARKDIAAAEVTEQKAEGERQAARLESDSEVERRRKAADHWEGK